MENAKRLVAAGAEFVKAEGGREIIGQVRAIIAAGIPFCGHLGMLPQHVLEEGGYHVKGKNEPEHQALLEDAKALADAGAFAIVLELVTPPVAKEISRRDSHSHHRHRQRRRLRRADSGDAGFDRHVPVVHAAICETAGELRGGNQNRRGGVEKFHRGDLTVIRNIGGEKTIWLQPKNFSPAELFIKVNQMELESLIESAAGNGASDLHLEAGMPAAVRVRGALRVTGEPVRAAGAGGNRARAHRRGAMAGFSGAALV